MSTSKQKQSFTTLKARFSEFGERTQIGSGKDCVIYRSKWKTTANKKTVVVKAYDKATISTTKVRSIKREARMMDTVKQYNVPHVVGFHGSFEDVKHMYIVMEYCGKGDLLEQILREGRAMEEVRVVNEVAIPLLLSLTAMHKLSLIHRDIKLENIFVDSFGRVKFGDFGLTMSSKEERGISPVGTVEYMAPELCRLPPAEYIMSGRIDPNNIQPIDEKVDIWALGVTFYELLTGKSPFEGANKTLLKQNIIRYKIRGLPKYLSLDCENFLSKMLSYEAHDRPSARALLNHPWIQTRNKTKTRKFTMSENSTGGEHSISEVITIGSQSEDFGGNHRDVGSKSEQRRNSENSPVPPLVSPTSILLLTERRREKFQDKLARLLPTYRSPHERDVCMRGLWSLSFSDDEDDEL